MINLKLNRGEVEDLQLGILDLILIEKKKTMKIETG